MKTKILALILYLSPVAGLANKIDSLHSDSQVESFAAKLIPNTSSYSNSIFLLKKPDSIYIFSDCFNDERTGKKQWQKTDFDEDGLTDLFIILYLTDTITNTGHYGAYTIFGSNNGIYRSVEIPGNIMLGCYSVEMLAISGRSYLLYNYSKAEYKIYPGIFDTVAVTNEKGEKSTLLLQKDSISWAKKSDTLVYRFDAFINANLTGNYSPEIKSVFFEAGMCFGFCDAFSLAIQKNGSAIYTLEKNINMDDGTTTKVRRLRGKIQLQQLNKILQLIRYMDISSLENMYEPTATHQQPTTLILRFSNGSIKTIKDYGLKGTPSLSRLYDLLFDLRHNQVWTK